MHPQQSCRNAETIKNDLTPTVEIVRLTPTVEIKGMTPTVEILIDESPVTKYN